MVSFKVYLIALLPALITPAVAECYGSGPTWTNTEVARSWVSDACFSNGGMFTGFYEARQTKSMCPRDGSLGFLFEVQNLNAVDGFDLADQDCYDRLTNEIFGCSSGGESIVAGWRFRADPGNC